MKVEISMLGSLVPSTDGSGEPQEKPQGPNMGYKPKKLGNVAKDGSSEKIAVLWGI